MSWASEWREVNRALWDERVPIHVDGDFYDVPSFLAGRSTLLPLELVEVGSVAGLTLVHPQCHFGLDTLSWARQGACVTGLDFSGPAIAAARELAGRAGLEAEFVKADVYDAPRAEFHPVLEVFGEDDLTVERSYFERGPLFYDESGTYADPDAPTTHTRTVEWVHGIGDVVSALAAAGLELELLHEHDCTTSPRFPFLERGADRVYRMPSRLAALPLMYSIRATRR